MHSSSLGDRSVVAARASRGTVTLPAQADDGFEIHARRLRFLNLVMAGVHTLLAIVTVVSTRNRTPRPCISSFDRLELHHGSQ